MLTPTKFLFRLYNSIPVNCEFTQPKTKFKLMAKVRYTIFLFIPFLLERPQSHWAYLHSHTHTDFEAKHILR